MEVRRLPMEQMIPLLQEQLQHGLARLPVTGSSMSPMLRNGRDVVMLEKISGSLQPGDVLLYRRESGQYVLHRLIRMEDAQTCLFCGDNQWEKELLSADRVIARVERFCRGGKWIDVRRHRGYRLYTFIWTALFPVRRIMIGTRRCLGRLRRILRRDKG